MATFEHYALVIPADYNQFTFEHSLVGVPDRIICTFGAKDDAGGLEDADREEIRDAWIAHCLPFFSEDLVFERIYASDAGGVVWEDFPAEPGLIAGAYGPISNAILVEKRSGVSGRRNRGRMFMPGAVEASVDQAGDIDPTYRAAVQTNVDALLTTIETALGGSSGGMYILHSKGWNGDVEPADPGNAPAPTKVTSLFVRPKIGTQRRRLR